MASGTDDFGQYMEEILLKGAVAMGIGLASKLQIFDLMESVGPKTYTEIAEAGNWKARYVALLYANLL